ncbi:MAG: UDP-N-acetylmuramoyl-L-alanine--D-glutamate ligase [Candidatus Omnitrophota bacterium]
MDVKNKTITVVGLGNSGVNACLLLAGAGAIVRATDSGNSDAVRSVEKSLESKGISVETGQHTEGFIKGSELVLVSPGIEESSPPVRWAVKSGIPIIGEMELGYRFCKGRIIAITGTNGKSTVTTLTGQILKAAGLDTVVCGNIGNSLCGEISKIGKDTWVVLEVSSFQLERIELFKPHIAIILNIRDDHMDRYARFGDYFNEKLKIFRNQDTDDFLILNGDAEELKDICNGRPGLKPPCSRVLFYGRTSAGDRPYDTKLRGLHNVENILACALAAKLAGVGDASIRRTVSNFKGLAHRFETVDTIDGIDYIDDSKGTTVDSTYRALESCDRPVILIAGGKDKHSDYSAIRDIAGRKVRKAVLIGEARGAIRSALEGVVEMVEAKDMYEAVSLAHSFAGAGSLILLSPMCSSFDMFGSYKERGEVFREAVKRLKVNRV